MKTLTPAYGRDYTSSYAAITAYRAGKDFILQDTTSRWDGKPCSIRDFPNEPVVLRYNNLCNCTILRRNQ